MLLLVLECLQNVLVMHLTNSFILFYICGCISSFILNSIQQQIYQLNGNHNSLLRKTMHDYAASCDTIDAINRCFGWICLVATTFCLIGFINGSFFLFVLLDSMSGVLFYISYFIHLALMCYMSDNLRHQVVQLKNCLKTKRLNQ